ncbi:GNAT family N-acetyltransferase [Oceanospirillum sediminis]|uniref:GNAT family N-acetyltransferase n=1 Tax=Oceanospirillum sediminis TaxID=2760088 RepID=A0A839IMY2_9GAMM|nr:GNAT family N-acetyltransferase [Oceanospirillum sediminis]MBB1486803.1 GNAT family N-acetyltransferase [Oceanospirillum sediminis]
MKYRPLAEALYHALTADAFYQTMEQSVEDPEQKKALMLCYLDYSMVESEQYGELFIPEGEAYGTSIWSMPLERELQAQKSAQKQHFLRTVMGENSLRTYNDIVSNMSEHTDTVIQENYWYLSIVGVLPAFQNQGLGAKLLQEVLQKSDSAGVATYLETYVPRNKSFYQRQGYQDIATFYEPVTGAEYSVMVREAQ